MRRLKIGIIEKYKLSMKKGRFNGIEWKFMEMMDMHLMIELFLSNIQMNEASSAFS